MWILIAPNDGLVLPSVSFLNEFPMSQCPICQKNTDHLLTQFPSQIDDSVVSLALESFKHEFPNWKLVDGVCRSCINYYIVSNLIKNQTTSPLAEEFLPHARDPYAVIPTPLKLNANPSYTGKKVNIAFIDSGFYPHPDLTQPQNRILRILDLNDRKNSEKDFIKPNSASWHGMMTASTAAGNGFLSSGLYRGIASDSNVLLLKVMNDAFHVSDQNIYEALCWLIKHRDKYEIDIVNISIYADDKKKYRKKNKIQIAIDELVKSGVVVVTAIGNDPSKPILPPADSEAVISVGGINSQNILDDKYRELYHSNFGKTAYGNQKPEIIAPAIWIAAPVLPGSKVHKQMSLIPQLLKAKGDKLKKELNDHYNLLKLPKDFVGQPVKELRKILRQKLVSLKFITPDYQHVDGTSFASPIIASVVAQLLEIDHSLDPQQIKTILYKTAEKLPNIPDEQQGHGVVMPNRATEKVLCEKYNKLKDKDFPVVSNDIIVFHFEHPDVDRVQLFCDFVDKSIPQLFQPVERNIKKKKQHWLFVVQKPAPGVYHYKYLLNGKHWIHDIYNPEHESDGYGGLNSILVV